MRFRVRNGFQAFDNFDAATVYGASGRKSGVQPIEAGRVLNLTAAQASQVLCRGELGRLEPVDDAALKFWSDNGSPVTVPDAVEHPERYYHERVEPQIRMEAVR